MFKTSFFRAIKAWLPTLIPAVGILLFAFLIVRPYFFETFVSPSNNMAPTILGQHYQGTCPECGKPAYCYAQRLPKSWIICDNFHISQAHINDTRIISSDRFLVTKFLKPRRWDIVAFKTPQDPSIRYVKRLVGLPGDEIVITDGVVWANGEKLEMPETIRNLKYIVALPSDDYPY